MNVTSYSLMRPWPAWLRLAGLLLALGLLDGLAAWGLLYVAALVGNYAYAHGINDTLGLIVWVTVLGGTVGIVLHLVALQRAVDRQQRARAVILLASSL